MEVAIVLSAITLSIMAVVTMWGVANRKETRRLRQELIQNGVISDD